MALDAVIFDVDGTLVDTNWAHVEAWERAFAAFGYKIPPDRIATEIGKGGDKLVPAVLGQQVADKYGKALRDKSSEEFLAIAGKKHFKLFPGVTDLLDRLRDKGLKRALATSSSMKQLQAILDSAGADLKAMVDAVITADDARATKPSPDLLVAALEKLEVSPAQAAMVGDTQYDAQASWHAGVACLALLCGGTGNTASLLRRAGARGVWNEPADLLDHLDEALGIASPGLAHLTQQVLEGLLREALASAREGLSKGEPPIGCVLARGDGDILARGHDELRHSQNKTAHAAIVAFTRAAGKVPLDARDLVLVTTVEPCVLCTGAAMEARADVIVYGLRVPADSGTGRVLPPEHAGMQMPRIVGDVLAEDCRALLEEGLRNSADPDSTAYLQRLLG